jgi:hypothetical protein
LQRLDVLEQATGSSPSFRAPAPAPVAAAAPFGGAFGPAAGSSGGGSSTDLSATAVYKGSGSEDKSSSGSATAVFKSADVAAMLKVLLIPIHEP